MKQSIQSLLDRNRVFAAVTSGCACPTCEKIRELSRQRIADLAGQEAVECLAPIPPFVDVMERNETHACL